MKIIFCDKDKEIRNLVKKEFGNKFTYKTNLDKVKADAISTCSNPEYTFGGGLDLYLKNRFNLKKGNWLDIQKGDTLIKNIVLNETVYSNISTDYELIRKAYANFFNVAVNNNWNEIVITAFGTGIGGFCKNQMIKALKEAYNMYLTIIGEKNIKLINITNLKLHNINNLNLYNCDSPTIKSCDYSTIKSCDYSTIESCDYSTIESCYSPTIESCDSPTIESCYYSTIESCYYSTIESCHSPTIKYCDYSTIESCHSSTIKSCYSPTIESCYSPTIESCYSPTIKSCYSPTIKYCDYSKIEYCDSPTIKSCYSPTIKYCNKGYILDSKIKATSLFDMKLVDCSGNVNYSKIKKLDCNIEETNKQTSFKKIFLHQFENNIAFKFLTKDLKSPWQDNKLQYELGKEITEKCNRDKYEDCAEGINLATLDWCLKNKKENEVLVAFEFNPKNAVVPINTDGKFRVPKCKCLYLVNEDGEKLK